MIKKIFLIGFSLITILCIASGCSNSDTTNEIEEPKDVVEEDSVDLDYYYYCSIMNDTLVSYLDCFSMPRAEVEKLASGEEDNKFIFDNISFLGRDGYALACFGSGEMSSDYNTLYNLEIIAEFKLEEMEDVKDQLEELLYTECSIDSYENGAQKMFNIYIPNTLFWIHCEKAYGEREGMLQITIHYDGEENQDYTTNYAPANNVNYNRHSDSEAWSCAMDIVRSKLKSPSTAEFCPFPDAEITHLGDGEYMVTGWVDAQNGYGAKVLEYFTVTYTATAAGYKNGDVIFY